MDKGSLFSYYTKGIDVGLILYFIQAGEKFIMKRKYAGSMKKYLIAVCIILAAIFLGSLVWMIQQRNDVKGYSEEYVAMKELPSQLSFTHYEEDQWKEKIGEINKKGLKGKLTYGRLEALLQILSLEEYITYEKQSSLQIVSRKSWNDIYEQILDLLDVEQQVKERNLVFLTEKSREGKRLTQKGYYETPKGVDYFGYYDTFRVYTRGNEIIGIKEVFTEEVTLKNVFIHKTEQEKAEILYENQQISLDIKGLKENITDTICDMVWKGNQVTAIYKKEDMIQGKVLSFGDKQIEISGYGTLKYEGKLKIYKTYGTVEQLDESKLVIGNLQADFVVAEKKVCGIILQQPASIENIRVLLLKDGAVCHDAPAFVADADCTLTVGEDVRDIPAGQVIRPAETFPEQGNVFVRIQPKGEQGRVYFSDEAGGKTSLGYRGSIEVRRYDQGYGVVNELSLEQYLYGVVPSEMPASYEKEALRTQAVCARSYACIQLLKNDYAAFAAHVDDSTNYQVYNKQEENQQTNLAVDDTVGEVIKYNGEIAEAYYFSTSCGHTDTMEVWNLPPEDKYGYLAGTTLLKDDEEPDFSSQDAFAAFIKNKDIAAYDSEGAYFRWRGELDPAGRLEQMNQAVLERYQVNKDNLELLKEDGSPASGADLAGFGTVTGMNIKERSSGGCIRRLEISYEHGMAVLLNEYNIRYVLGKTVTRLTDKTDQQVEMALLPSAYCTVIPVEKGYVVYGGGYGHGIGMSQNGANGMAKAGKSYTDILMKFYQGITIENIYNGE